MGTTEIKRVDLSWYEKCGDSANEYAYLEELLQIDRDLMECDNILSEVNLQTGYKSHADEIYETAEKRQHLQSFIIALPEYIETHLDEPLYQGFRKANEALKQIRMKDFKVENTLGLRITPLGQEKYGRHREERRQDQGLRFITAGKGGYGKKSVKEWLTLEDFVGNIVGDLNVETPILGTNSECVEEFAVIFSGQYEDMLRRGEVEAKIGKADYLDQFSVLGEEVYPPTLGQRVASNLLDLTIVKPIIESCCGYNLITGEKQTEFERSLNVVFAAVDLITLVTGISEFAKAAEIIGVKEAASYIGKQFMVELSADASAAVAASIGEDREWPSWLTLTLSLMVGIITGQIGNSIAFSKAGTGSVETGGKSESGTVTSLADLMSPEDAERYLNFLENGSTVGLTGEEIAALEKIDELLAWNRIDYQDIRNMRKTNEIAESAADVHREIDEWEIFYDDIFEQQRKVDPEYEDYLEELGQLHNELDIVFESGTPTLNDWVNKTSDLLKQVPIEIPSNATVKVQAKNGYDQITFKWTENGQNYEVRWHTKTPGAPEGQGNTWVVSRVTPGTPTGQVRTEHILVGDT